MPALDSETIDLVGAVEIMNDDDLVTLLKTVAEVRTCVDRLSIIGAGVAARRSQRDLGYQGLASKRGHRTPAAMIQAITGGTAASAKKAVQAGESLLPPLGAVGPDQDSVTTSTADAVALDWHAPLGRALLCGDLTLDQHDAIRNGLGEPPCVDGEAADAVTEVWSIAATQLIGEARSFPVEELRARARAVRDALDPRGAELRFAQRYDARSFRVWTDRNGQRQGHFVFDDDGGSWVDAVIDAALRPRRGGPRFVDSEAKAAGADLQADPRTNEQLAYDLLFDVLRAGSLAAADDVFGARQPGVRVVVVADENTPRDLFGRLRATGYTEDRGLPVPGSMIDRAMCDTGTVRATFDRTGSPLDLGREQRLFGRAQRVMLALRDGGCRWPGCTRPPSYCEAHHCDHWRDDGRTDIHRGILLCRHHHMLLHNNGWRITRDGNGPFVLHGQPGSGIAPAELLDKPAWSWAWDPPPPPDRPGWRSPRRQLAPAAA